MDYIHIHASILSCVYICIHIVPLSGILVYIFGSGTRSREVRELRAAERETVSSFFYGQSSMHQEGLRFAQLINIELRLRK